MSTLADMKARIALELRRSNLTAEIAAAITTAIGFYSSERFRFSDIDPATPPTFNTVPLRWVYDSNDNANISTAYSFDYVFINIGSTIQYLERQTPMQIKLYNQHGTTKGPPTWYAYEGNKLLLSAIPDQAYQVTLGVFLNVPAPADDAADNNPWMNDAEVLIRSRAKYEIAKHVTRNKDMEQSMSPMPPAENGGRLGATYEAWESLKGVANKVTGRGRIRAMPF